jgi:glycosyltransferase involved in cell wall biosynthesis
MALENVSPDVAFCVYCLDGGGAERALLNLARGYANQHYRVELVLFSATGAYMNQVPPNVHIFDLQSKNSLDGLLKLIQYFRRRQPKCLISTMHFANELCVLAKCLSGTSSTLIVNEQNTLSREIRGKNRFKKLVLPLAVRMLYPGADRIVAVSEGAALDLAKTGKLSPQKVDVIHNPVIRDELFEQAKQSVSHPWFAPGSPPVVLAIGRFVPQKDFPTLVRAFAKVCAVSNARLVILGSRAEYEPIDELIQELGLQDSVATPGFTDNPYAYIARSAVFALSSLWEGLPTVLIEALALGIPVVSTDCEHGPSEILAGGKYGTLVPVGDSDALAKGILTALQAESRIKADEQWLSQFTLEAALNLYQRYFQTTSPEIMAGTASTSV